MARWNIPECQWSDELLTHNESIDAQHRELVKRMGQCIASLNAPHEFSFEEELEILDLVVFLLDYVIAHFSHEERIMIESDFPDFLSHRIAHSYYITRLVEFKNRFKQEGFNEGLAEVFHREIVEWLVNHIKYDDRRIASWSQSGVAHKPSPRHL
ncbi:hemerythrin family protein [Desulfurispirillum indicum]|uniref:Hemerythrin-like metal-binding protein n=1 Tax=Desulfurispirillum indicum (strain ATCC BAA-1389 / DSM 22839 / S5) TaxID=653733 RepID=E6W1Y2_DESIS|nr:hemerythrin family protein [Desulfurispirillum indicum]ADU66608.1 hemerythrin-like metal-binding protein [Desulfurispirillum indicum S5]UCZ55926.1 hemerythrin family protein [Desulfurispirillum indicum]